MLLGGLGVKSLVPIAIGMRVESVELRDKSQEFRVER